MLSQEMLNFSSLIWDGILGYFEIIVAYKLLKIASDMCTNYMSCTKWNWQLLATCIIAYWNESKMLKATLYHIAGFYCEEFNVVIGSIHNIKIHDDFICGIFYLTQYWSHKYLVAIHVHV